MATARLPAREPLDALPLGAVLDLEPLRKALHRAAGDAIEREGMRSQVAERPAGKRALALMSMVSGMSRRLPDFEFLTFQIAQSMAA